MTKIVFLLVGLTLLSCTGPLNEETMADMPTSYLCRILSPDYISLPSEQLAIYKELERRGQQCVNTQQIIIKK